MTVMQFPRLRRADPIQAAAEWAVRSVPAHLSARGLAVPVWAAMMLPAVALLPVASPWASLILAPVFALAAGLRLAALVNLFLPKAPEPPPLADGDLPAVTVLVSLFREAAVMPDLVAAVARLDYPPHLLEVMLLEEADTATITAARAHAPAGWRTIVVPPGSPQTKPRACNVGLARGDVVVVFDGEDRPDPDPPRKAAAALAADPRLAVVQARLGCDHAGAGSPIVIRLWALEYAALFGAVLPLLSRLGLPFLLGGTSNWFRAEALRQAGGWDAHNVTEDADLGVRLARLGWRSGVIDSTTWEEALLRAGVWLRQRARWFKGFEPWPDGDAPRSVIGTPRRQLSRASPNGAPRLALRAPASCLKSSLK